MFCLVFRYHVRAAGREDFERVYGPAGDWAELFRQAEGYAGTELWSDRDAEDVYLVVDHWSSAAAHAAFLEVHGRAYAALGAEVEHLWEREERLGSFERAGTSAASVKRLDEGGDEPRRS